MSLTDHHVDVAFVIVATMNHADPILSFTIKSNDYYASLKLEKCELTNKM